MQSGSYLRLDFRRITFYRDGDKSKRKENNSVRIGAQSDEKIVVVIKTAARDLREKVEDKNGKLVTNKRFDKIAYETVESIDVFDAKPAEVKEAVIRGLSAAASAKK
jgi:hypothetical protein